MNQQANHRKHRINSCISCVMSFIVLVTPAYALPTRTAPESGEIKINGDIQKVKAGSNLIAELDKADSDAQQASIAYIRAVGEGPERKGLKNAIEVLHDAEWKLNQNIERSWNTIELGARDKVWIQQPLVIAGLELQIYLRRRLGPSNRTVVPGLDQDTGCRGDIIRDRLIYRLITASSTPSAKLMGQPLTTASVLERLALQVMCLSSSQLSEFETGLVQGVETISQRLKDRGKQSLVPAFLRVTAPAVVLVYDARKHRGINASSVGFFRRHGNQLLSAIQASGWPDNKLLLWDRRRARLVGIPFCDGRSKPGCVGMTTLISSLSDPRAIGLGDCSLAAMVTLPAMKLGRQSRYVCPLQSCADEKAPLNSFGNGPEFGAGRAAPNPLTPQSKGNGLSTDIQSRLKLSWPNLGTKDIREMSSLCRPQGSDVQKAHTDLSSCLEGQSKSPFETYTGCIGKSIGAGEGPKLLGSLPGVPLGDQCSLSSGNTVGRGSYWVVRKYGEGIQWLARKLDEATKSSGTTSDDKPTPKEPAQTKVRSADSNKIGDSEVNGSEANKPAKDGIENILSKDASDVGSIDSDYTESLDKLSDIAKAMGDKAFYDQVNDWLGDTDEYTEKDFWDTASSASLPGEDDEPEGTGSSIRASCVEPDCNDNCSSLGQLLQDVEGCTNSFLNSTSEITGRGRPDLRVRPNIISYPNPEAENPDPTGSFSCLGNYSNPGHLPKQCGLILCANGSLANITNNECSCRERGINTVIKSACLTVRCANGTFPNTDCLCTDPAAPEIPPRPGPGPE